MIALEPYPLPRPGYTVPEFGGRLNGAEEDAAILAAVVADAQATQSIHREMIQRMSDWETREPGIISSDDELRNAFIANLDGLRTAFTDRALQTVGVSFPMMLDRANPAHAVVIAVRDDIADTRDRLAAKRAGELLNKQIQDTKITLPEVIVRETASTVSKLTTAAAKAAEDVGKGAKDAAGAVGWALGAALALYLLTQRRDGR